MSRVRPGSRCLEFGSELVQVQDMVHVRIPTYEAIDAHVFTEFLTCKKFCTEVLMYVESSFFSGHLKSHAL